MSIYADYLMSCLCVLVTGFVLFALYMLAVVAASATVNARRNLAAGDMNSQVPQPTQPEQWGVPIPPYPSSPAGYPVENGIPTQRGFPPVS